LYVLLTSGVSVLPGNSGPYLLPGLKYFLFLKKVDLVTNLHVLQVETVDDNGEVNLTQREMVLKITIVL